MTYHCQCPCAATKFTIAVRPFVRFYCHCEFCQDFNQADKGDVCLVAAKHVQLADDADIVFKNYSPLVARGHCRSCKQAAIEFTAGPKGLKFAGIPSKNITDQSALPKPACHGFYHRRQADETDSVPKHSGFLASQLAFGRHISAALLKNSFLPK